MLKKSIPTVNSITTTVCFLIETDKDKIKLRGGNSKRFKTKIAKPYSHKSTKEGITKKEIRDQTLKKYFPRSTPSTTEIGTFTLDGILFHTFMVMNKNPSNNKDNKSMGSVKRDQLIVRDAFVKINNENCLVTRALRKTLLRIATQTEILA